MISDSLRPRTWLRRVLVDWSDFIIVFNIISILLTGFMATFVFFMSIQIDKEGALRDAEQRTQIELLKQEDERLREQQLRIIQALDNTYNLLQEHLRTHNGNTEKGPPNLDFDKK